MRWNRESNCGWMTVLDARSWTYKANTSTVAADWPPARRGCRGGDPQDGRTSVFLTGGSLPAAGRNRTTRWSPGRRPSLSSSGILHERYHGGQPKACAGCRRSLVPGFAARVARRRPIAGYRRAFARLLGRRTSPARRARDPSECGDDRAAAFVAKKTRFLRGAQREPAAPHRQRPSARANRWRHARPPSRKPVCSLFRRSMRLGRGHPDPLPIALPNRERRAPSSVSGLSDGVRWPFGPRTRACADSDVCPS